MLITSTHTVHEQNRPKVRPLLLPNTRYFVGGSQSVVMETVRSVGVLTVSDTCSRDATQDRSGPKLREMFEKTSPPWSVAQTAICADSIVEIQKHLEHWINQLCLDVVITTGGTGFAETDVTPEAVKPLLDREAPGLVHAMFAKSFTITPLAAMARLVAGVSHKSLVITVPGSPKGAVENAEAILKLLPHASDLTSGRVGSRALHAASTAATETKDRPSHLSQQDHDCKHTHRHDSGRIIQSNDPSLAVTKRARSSPYPMTPVSDALELILNHTPPPQVTFLPIAPKENDLTNYITAEDIYSKEAVPAYRASIVDGYAVISSDGIGPYPVVSISHASPGTLPDLRPGQITRITTGAPLPPGADSVVMVEDTKLIASTDDGKEEKVVEILVRPAKNDNIREIGSDVEKGTLVMSKGERITGTGGEIGILASAGLQIIPVYRKPVIGVISTGDELIDPSVCRVLENGEIRDTNRISLLSAIRHWNFPALDLGIAKDQSTSLTDTLRAALTKCDVIVTTGGVSMGELDLLKPTIERQLNGTIHFGRVAMKPGKPTTFATVLAQSASLTSPTSTDKETKKAIFALPGNPASALVTFHLFVLPYVRYMSGHSRSNASLPRLPVSVSHDIPLDPRPECHRVIVAIDQDGKLSATSTGGQRSSRVGSLKCNGFLCLPASCKDQKELKKGEIVQVMMIDAIVTK